MQPGFLLLMGKEMTHLMSPSKDLGQNNTNTINNGHYVQPAALLQCIRAAHSLQSDQNEAPLCAKTGH